MKKLIFNILVIFGCFSAYGVDKAIEDAINNSDTPELLRLVSGNFTVSEYEKAYYLKLAKAKSENSIKKMHRALPKFSRAAMGVMPLLLGLCNLIYCGIRIHDHWCNYPPYMYGLPDANSPESDEHWPSKPVCIGRRMEWSMCTVGIGASLALIAFSSSEIYKGIVENSEVVSRDNALAIETIISRLRIV